MAKRTTMNSNKGLHKVSTPTEESLDEIGGPVPVTASIRAKTTFVADVSFLMFLYVLQGIPLGLAGTHRLFFVY
jgi:hypothetical protein